MTHFSIMPFKAICGADEVGQSTTQCPERSTCPDCQRSWDVWSTRRKTVGNEGSGAPRPAPNKARYDTSKVQRAYSMVGVAHPETVMRWFLDIKHYWFDGTLGDNMFTGMRDDAERYLFQWVETGKFPKPMNGLEMHCEMKMEEWLRDCWIEARPAATASAPSLNMAERS